MSVGQSATSDSAASAELIEPPLLVELSAAPLAVQPESWRRSVAYWLCSLLIHVTFLGVAVLVMNGRSGGGHGNGQRGGSGTLSVTFLQGSSNQQQAGGFDTALPSTEQWEPETSNGRTTAIESVANSFTLTDPQNVFQRDAAESVSLEALLNEPTAPRTRQREPAATTQTTTPPTPQNEPVVASTGPAAPGRFNSNATANDNGPVGLDRSASTENVENNGRPGRGVGRGQGAGSGNGAGDRTQFFGIDVRAKRFVYVIDASDSMLQHHALDIAREELWLSLQELAPPTKFQVVFFNLGQHAVAKAGERPQLLLASPTNLRLAFQSMAEVQTDSGTDRLRALTYALRFEPDAVFLLTDAESPMLSAVDLNKIRSLYRGKAAIHVVEFGLGADLSEDNFLKSLARQNQGSYRYHDLSR